MKRFVLIGLMVFGLAAPAVADVDLFVDIDKDVNIKWNQKANVDIDLKMELDPGELAVVDAGVADAFSNQKFDLNSVVLERAVVLDETVNSVNENEGITGVNQASGSLNNQGNAVSVSVVTGTVAEEPVAALAGKGCGGGGNCGGGGQPQDEAEEVAFVQAIGAADQKNVDNDLITTRTEVSAVIEGSINTNTGIVGFNQSPGNFNNQDNAVAVAAGLEGVEIALAEGDLGQFHTGAILDQINYTHTGSITNSISGNTGITHVNQSTGNMNNQSNVVSIAAVPFAN